MAILLPIEKNYLVTGAADGASACPPPYKRPSVFDSPYVGTNAVVIKDGQVPFIGIKAGCLD